MHSSQYVSGASHEGKKVVVVGSGTSAHDICQDLWEHGADVTMIQRSPTPITKVSTHQQICLQRLLGTSSIVKQVTLNRFGGTRIPI